MNTLNSMLRSIPLATMVVFALLVLATGTVSAAPRQQAVDICSRTQEVQDAILAKVSNATCSTITDTQLASIQYLFTDGYSSDTVIPGDFANLTGLVELGIFDSSALTTVPANAFSEVTGYSNLINVGLVRNVITDVHIDAFEGLSGITTLGLDDNLIETLEPGVFDGLSNLTILALTNNNIQNLEPGIFDGLGMLTQLKLSNNGLKGLDNAVFGDLSELEILYLGTNELSALDAGTFNGLTNLQQLVLTNNGLSELPAGIFNGLDELMQLYLGANSLTDLDAAIFAGLDDSLGYLYLNSNRLSTLPSGIFAGLTGLQTLDLNNNGISTLPADVFAPLDDSLGTIALSRNSLSTLDADIFDGLTGLQRLHLQDNSLSSLPAGIFDGLTGLQRLYLNDNSLSTLPANVFAPLGDALQHVYLSNNNLSSLDADTFDGLTGLIGLYIENNDSLSSLPATIFEDLDESLLYLYLGNNSLSSLDVDIFDGLTGLQRLYLNDNSLSSLDADIFDGLTALQRLYLNHNSLSSLPATIFEDLDDSLWHLVLTKNTVVTLPTNIFGGLTGLQGLDLSCNSFNALPLARFDPFASSLTYLDVSGNGYGSTPTDTDLRNKFTKITDMSGSLYTGVNTECLPPYEFGLSGLSLSTGTLNPAFQAPGKDVYNTRVGHDVSSITVTVTPKDSRAMIEPRSGSNWEYDNDEKMPGIQVDLTGVRTNIGWQVRVRNGAFSYPYQIAVYRDHPPASNALLRSLELSGAPLDETFDGRTDTYTATAAASETTVTATPLDPDATTVIKLNDMVDADGTVDLNLGSNNVITVEVAAEDGTTMQTYTVTVMRTTVPGVSVSPTELTVTEEDATGDSYTVVLDSQPTAGVTVTVAGHSGTEVTTSPATLTFSTTNWETPQTVTVTAAADANLVNEMVTLTHSAASADSDYSGISIASVAVTVNDNTPTNALPTFTEGASTSRAFNETLGDEAVATAGNIGTPVAATDADNDTLTYSLEGTAAARFGIVRTSGQLQTKVGEKYSHEENSSYSVRVKVEDGNSGSDTIVVTLNVMDVNEPPLAPNAPSVSATPGSNNSLDVSWTAPTNTGRPNILNYDLQYQKTTETGWTDGPQNETGPSATIGNLDTGTEYRVQVRATNAEGGDNWSESGNGSTNTPANALPAFTEGGSTSRAFNETLGDASVATAGNIGTPVGATDADTGDTLTYSLEGTDAARFGIVRTSGQLQTKVGEKYDYEAKSSYSVMVKVEDGNSGSDTIVVTLNVMDVNEPPLAPNAPSVSATPRSNNSLDVSWTAPTNTGRPNILNYDLQYQKTTETGWTDGPQNETGPSATIGNLDTGTEYRVQVRATNAEGAVAWSASGTGRTDTPTAPGVSVLPTVLTVTEEDTAGASYTVVLDSQPTADVTVTVGGHSGTEVTPTPTSLTFTTSNWESAQMVTVTAGADADTENESVTLTHSAVSMDSEYQGITIDSVAVTVNDIAVGICGRTKEVRDALLAQIPGVSGCAAVTAAHLAAITGTLDLSGQSIADLAAGDFAGLTSLEVLYLNNNDLTELPGGVFEPLTSLEVLYLNNNDLTTLPGGVFDQLTMLKVLTLYYNALTILPDGVFELLTRLNFLYMEDNPGVPFAPTADARPDAGRVAVDGGTVRLDGSGSGEPWGTNVSYSWALTTPASGVTFDDATSVTPEVTIPELAADTELTFTLTVTGRGHIGSGTGTGTATAKVTATLNITNNPPVFAGGTAQARILAETLGDAAVTTASDIGAPVSATDTDTDDTLTYVLLGADRDKFTFDTSIGQIKTRSGESYDYEAQSSYSVTVAVIDGTVTVSAAVTINVTDQNEPPLAMTAPIVMVTQESATSLEVSWTEPTNTGRPNIDSYDLQYRVGNTGGFINGPQNRTGTSAPIGKLTANTSYEVQVRATNAEGDGAWSVAGSGTTGTTTTADTPGVSVSPTALTVTEGDTTGDSYTVVLDSQPTAGVTVTVAGHSGTEVTTSPATLTFSTTNWETPQTVTVTAAADANLVNEMVTLTHSAASADSDYSGISIASVAVTVTDNDDTAAAGICGRTAEVRDELLRLIENNEGAAVACADVTAAQLAAITGPLDLAVENITVLAAGDFAGLTALKTLNLDHNELTALPDDVFDGLTALKVLYLNDNKLTALPDDVFDGLTALDFLYLGNNELTMLPEDVFAGLTSLKLLYLDNNGLTALPDNVFEPLTALKVLRLQGNPVASFAPEADARPDNGTVPVGGGTVRLDGSGSGGAWGTNVAYRWALTSPGSGVTVMFDNDRSATPVVTIPELTAGTALTFTLTVTGRGHIGSATGIGTDTAKVTATDSVTASGDATLGGLTVNDGTSYLTLAPAFALGTFVYTASVGNAVATVTLTATVNHAGASVSAVTLDGNAIADSDFTDGITVSSLIEGGNGIVVTVTAENGATQTYTVTVSRAATTATAAGVSVSETALTVTEGDTTGDSYTVVLDTQPTAGVTVTVAGHSGTDVTPNPTSLIFTTSNWNTAQTITVTAADTVTMNDTVTLTHSAASTDSNYSSITIADVTVPVNDDDTAAGICPRTPEVRDALLALISGVSGCADVTDAQLAAITGPLKLSSQSIDELAAGDFAGLTALETLNLFNNELTALPDDVFAGLTALETLNLGHNELTALPDNVFAGLTALKVLYLNDNKLTALPDDVFAGLTSLEFLYLGKNKQLPALPVGVFAGLTELKLLYLDNNGLTALPDGVFEGLISLQVLRLQGNPVASFAPTADALPDDGTVLVAGGTVTLDGSGSGGPWGTNVTYRWALTTPASGVTVMFDNATSAMPEATIQALAADTELTFTLTVTGRGHIGSGTDTGTDTAKVTATEPMARAARSNSAATGAPTINGTAQVAETLTANTAGIADADGLVNATYSYQWVANDGTTDTDIAGETDATYTLVADDEGQTIKVKVSFADDADNRETLTSAATAVVAAPEPPAKPTGLSAAAVSHDVVTLTWDDPQDDAITGYVILRRDRAIHPTGTFVTIAGDTGSADTTYTDDTVEPDKEYVYRIKAINEHGEVSERSDWVRGFTPAAPSPAG